jgi:hypothetical protein
MPVPYGCGCGKTRPGWDEQEVGMAKGFIRAVYRSGQVLTIDHPIHYWLRFIRGGPTCMNRSSVQCRQVRVDHDRSLLPIGRQGSLTRPCSGLFCLFSGGEAWRIDNGTSTARGASDVLAHATSLAVQTMGGLPACPLVPVSAHPRVCRSGFA